MPAPATAIPASTIPNPYFTFDPAKCIVCSRAVRACEEVQGTFALTISGRGFDSIVAAGMDEKFIESECVSCGACVQACPTGSLREKTVIDQGKPEWSVLTTCAYCGVGCAFKVEMRGDEVVRMVPYKDGKANRGHSCVKGRFAWGYANHRERILKPMIRDQISEPWREVSWEDAIGRVASEFKRIQAEYGRGSIGGITSSRCTDEETFLVQKLVRAAFGNNNVDTCARVCHSPTGYGLETTFGNLGWNAGFRFRRRHRRCGHHRRQSDRRPSGLRLTPEEARCGQGAKLIIIDPRRIDLVRMPHVEAAYHLPLLPGTNVAMLTALAHVVVTEGLVDEKFVARALRMGRFQDWAAFVAEERNSPEAVAKITGVPAATIRAAARLYATGGNGAIYRPRHHRTQPGFDRGYGHRQPRHGDRKHRPARRRREPAARAEQRPGLVRHGLIPARTVGLPAHRRRRHRAPCSRRCGRGRSTPSPACASQHARRRLRRAVQGGLHPGRGHPAVRPATRTMSPPVSRRWNASWCRTCS